MGKPKHYPLHQCPLYKAYSLEWIAEVLTIRPRKINHPKYRKPEFKKLLALTATDIETWANAGDNNYVLKEIEDRKGKKRLTEVPIPELKLIHRRIAEILERIEPPPYLYSATKKRSYVSNAEQHTNGKPLLRIDIKKFFPSTSSGYIYHFFRNILCAEKHVAAVLTKLCTKSGHLPTGSPLSPILSFYAHNPMFDKIYALATARGCTMTLYVDDVHISGDNATDGLLWEVKQIIHRHGMKYHKEKSYKATHTKKVTGTIVVDDEIRLRNRSHKEIHEGIIKLREIKSPEEQLKLLQKLMGQVNEARQIEPETFAGKAEYLRNYKRSIQNRMASEKNKIEAL